MLHLVLLVVKFQSIGIKTWKCLIFAIFRKNFFLQKNAKIGQKKISP